MCHAWTAAIRQTEMKLMWGGNAICALIGEGLTVGCGGF